MMDRACVVLRSGLGRAFVAGVVGVLLGAAASAQADGFRLRHTPEMGHEHRYDLRVSMRLTQKMAEEPERIVDLEQRARLRLRVERIEPSGVARIALTVDSFSQRYDAGEGEGTMLFERPKLTTEIEPDTDEYRAFAGVGGAIAGMEATVLVNAEGRITAVEGLEEIARALGGQDVFDPSLVGVFSGRQLAATLQPVFNADRSEGAAPVRRAGDGWQMVESVPLGPVGAFEIVTEMRVASVDGGVARLEGSPEFAILRPAQADASVARVRIAAQSGGVEMGWDVRRSMLTRRVATQDIETVWTMGQIELRQTQKAETRLELVRE